MADDEKERELVLRREIPFPRELVWKALTDPEHVNSGGAQRASGNEGVSMDLRVGGAWRFEMVGPDGICYPNHSEFEGGKQHLSKLEAYVQANLISHRIF